MFLGFIICSLPVFWWNIQTGWLQVQALSERGGLDRNLAFRPDELLKYVGGQLGAITPLLLIGMVVAAVGLWRTQSDQARVKHLLSQYIPIQVMYLLLSLTSRVQPNWIAPSLIAGIVLLVAFWRPLILHDPKRRWGAWVALGLGLTITLALHVASFLPIPVKYDVLHKAEGWVDFAQHVQRAREEHHPGVLIANYYTQASMMQFYLPDHPVTYLPPARRGNSQFTLWPGYEVRSGMRALYVVDHQPVLLNQVKEQFNRSRLVDDFWAQFHGRRVEHFFIFLLWNE